MNQAIGKRWYVLQVYSGMEKSALAALQEAIKSSSFAHLFGNILLPTEEVMDNRAGKKVVRERRFFPGYVFIEMEITDESWYLVTQTKSVSGFIGGSKSRPAPVSAEEVARIMSYVQQGENPRPKIEFIPGEIIRVVDGPFKDFTGHVEEVSYDKSRLRISINILGRNTPVELAFEQVEKEV
jgi:transcription termination/antitermination protein NusG